MHRRAELFYQQLGALQTLRRTVRGELLTESRKHAAVKLLRQVPFIGPLRAAQLLALMQTPHRFRSKRQLWTYSGLADSDSTGLIAGHLLGAMRGLSEIPARWLATLELRGVIEEVADDLATVGAWQLGSGDDSSTSAEEEYYTQRYPGV